MPKPHAGQRRILDLPGRFKVAVCGRRFGKNVVATILALKKAREGGQVVWIEPTEPQALLVLRAVREYIHANITSGKNEKGEWRQHADRFEHIKSRGHIYFFSAKKMDGLRGLPSGIHLAILDEAADIAEIVWRQIILPQLLDHDGEAVLMGTPKGKRNWLHQIFEHASCDPKWSRYHAKSSENPLITLDKLDAMRAEMTEIEFRQEFDAEFLDSASSMFPGVELHVKCEPRGEGAKGVRYATGIDLGQTAFCVCASIDPRTNVSVSQTRWNRQPWAVNEARVRAHKKRFPGPATIDATGVGSMPSENMDDIADPYIFTETTRARLLRNLAVAWEKEAVFICNDPQLIHELRCMEWTEKGEAPHTQMVASSTIKLTDCVMALALAWDCRTRHGDAPVRKGNSWLSF